MAVAEMVWRTESNDILNTSLRFLLKFNLHQRYLESNVHKGAYRRTQGATMPAYFMPPMYLCILLCIYIVSSTKGILLLLLMEFPPSGMPFSSSTY